jgi:hypothetical protein
MSPTLSVCLMTGGPGPRVAALLALLRPHAGELVVALDDRADQATGAAISGIADTTIRYRYREPVDRPLPWLFSLCRNDWILNIDDDEIPGAELLAELPELIAATEVTHYWLMRKWLWPDAGSAIAEHPWTSDYQLRLVRNDPLLLRFPSETHRPICVLGPHRVVQAPLYHADAILNTVEQRAAKARKYEALRPGKRVGGGPMNHVFHLPERREGILTEPLPEADAALVRAVLDAPWPPKHEPGEPIAVVSDQEIDRLWAGRLLGASDRRGEIAWLEVPRELTASNERTFAVSVTNRGGQAWPGGKYGEPGVRLTYEWLDDGGAVVESGPWTAIPAELASGAEQTVLLHVVAPPAAGRYRLRVDLIQEHVGWFGNAIECDVEVTRRLRVALAGDADAVARTLDQLAEEAPSFEPVVLSSEPKPLFGPPRAPDARAYLLDGTPTGRLREFRVLAARTIALVRVARGLKAGVPVRPLLRDAQPFLEELGASSHLLLVGPTERFGTRELWLQLAMVSAARELGVEVIVQRGATARPHGLLDRVLLRKVLWQTRVVEPGELGLV